MTANNMKINLCKSYVVPSFLPKQNLSHVFISVNFEMKNRKNSDIIAYTHVQFTTDFYDCRNKSTGSLLVFFYYTKSYSKNLHLNSFDEEKTLIHFVEFQLARY
jgi:hypothetical protein